MQNVTLIGIDLGKHSFYVHCQDEKGHALLRKKFPDYVSYPAKLESH